MIIQNPKYKLVYASFEQESNKSYVTVLGSESGIPAVAPATDSTIVAKTTIPVGTSVSLPGGYKLVYFKDGKIYGSASGIPAGGDAEIDTSDLFVDSSAVKKVVSIEATVVPTSFVYDAQAATPATYDFTSVSVNATLVDGSKRDLETTEYAIAPTPAETTITADDVATGKAFTVTAATSVCYSTIPAATSITVTVTEAEA